MNILKNLVHIHRDDLEHRVMDKIRASLNTTRKLYAGITEACASVARNAKNSGRFY